MIKYYIKGILISILTICCGIGIGIAILNI